MKSGHFKGHTPAPIVDQCITDKQAKGLPGKEMIDLIGRLWADIHRYWRKRD